TNMMMKNEGKVNLDDLRKELHQAQFLECVIDKFINFLACHHDIQTYRQMQNHMERLRPILLEGKNNALWFKFIKCAGTYDVCDVLEFRDPLERICKMYIKVFK